jgi:hypothetical protein
VNRDVIIERILAERQRHFNLPYCEQDVCNAPNDWVAIIGRYVFEETRRGIVKPDRQNFEDNLIKAGAVLLAALEHCEMMQQKCHFAEGVELISCDLQ